MISIKGLSKADVLAVLYNASRPQGMGFRNYDPKPMTREQAQEILDQGDAHFDYLQGRVMKVNLSGDEFEEWGFDRDNGQGSAERAVKSLGGVAGTRNVNSKAVQEIHRTGTLVAAEQAKEMLSQRTVIEGNVMTLGLDDVAPLLHSSIGKAARKARE